MEAYKNIKNARIGIFLNYIAASPSPELFASFIEEMVAQGNECFVYYCDASLQGCSFNPIKSKALCNLCRGNVGYLKDEFGPNVTFQPIDLAGASPDASLPPSLVSELDIAAMSSVASLTKATEPGELSRFWKKVLKKFEDDAYRLHRFFSEEIAEKKFTHFTCFNGRFFDSKPVLTAARSSGISFILLEVKKSEMPLVFVDELIHSVKANCDRAIRFYKDSPEDGRKHAEEFFEKKVKQVATGDPVYTKNQIRGQLPDYIPSDRKLVVVYPTTDDEYKFIGQEWDGIVPEDQVTEIEDLCARLDGCFVVVKMHPNQAHMTPSAIQRYLAIEQKFPNTRVEPPLSKVDTYSIMQVADIVVNFASTIGIEASYFGKKVVNIGDTNFTGLGAVEVVSSGIAAAELINSDELPEPRKVPAMMWGNYLYKYRSGLDSFSREDGKYRFRGKETPRSRFKTYLSLAPKLLIRLKKNKVVSS